MPLVVNVTANFLRNYFMYGYELTLLVMCICFVITDVGAEGTWTPEQVGRATVVELSEVFQGV
jgi:hypothetical protein